MKWTRNDSDKSDNKFNRAVYRIVAIVGLLYVSYLLIMMLHTPR